MGRLLYLVERGWAWAGCGPAQSPHLCAKCNSHQSNGQCTNLILFDKAHVPIEGLKLTCSTYLSCHRLLIYILTSAFRRWRLQSWSQSFVVSTCIVQHAMSERRYHQITSKMWTLNNICGFVLAANPLHLEPPLPVLPSPTVELYISFATCRYSFCVHEAKTVKCFRQRLTFCLSVCLFFCLSVC